jgi:hypothetical protein
MLVNFHVESDVEMFPADRTSIRHFRLTGFRQAESELSNYRKVTLG